jgi:O-antigen ligase
VTGIGPVCIGDDFDLLKRTVPVAAKASLFAVLAFLGGVGTVYAPLPTFTVVAATFTLALWWLVRDPDRFRPKVSRGAEQESKPRSTWMTKLVSGYLLVWWLAMIAPIATYIPRETTSAEVATAVSQGSLRNQILIMSFGLVGTLFLPAAIKRFDPTFRWVAALWALYLCWAFASLSWSIYLPLTLRNTVAFALVSVGTFGLGAGFYGSLPNGRDLFLRHVFMAGVLSALVVLVPLPLHWQQYDLLDPSQRVTIGDNVNMTQVVVRPVMCALLVLVATHVLQVRRRWRKRDWFWVAILVLPLLVMKARGPVLWGILAFIIFYLFYKVKVRDRVLQAGLLLVIGVGTYVSYSTGVFGWLIPFLTRGAEYPFELSGRIPLWPILLPEIEQRPWLGAGFAAFWNPENIYKVEQLAGWSVSEAHNGFLDEALNTGMVGLAILLTFCFYTMVVVVRRARRGEPFGWLVFLFLLYYLLHNLTISLMQEYFEVPFVIVLATLALMSSKPRKYSPTPQRDAPGAARGRVGSTR